jgi:hypothetical protein
MGLGQSKSAIGTTGSIASCTRFDGPKSDGDTFPPALRTLLDDAAATMTDSDGLLVLTT